MGTLDKEIKVIALKGEKGNSAYQDAVENELFSGTLAEFMSTFATPDNYITRYEYKKVTQAEYDALEQSGQIINNCYYIITDDDTWETIQDALSLASDVVTLQDDVGHLKDDVEDIEASIGNITEDLGTLTETTLPDLVGRVTILENSIDGITAQYQGNAPYINTSTEYYEAKSVTTPYALTIAEGTEIYVKFSYYGSELEWNTMTLNVNNNGAYYIAVNGSPITVSDNAVWGVNDIVRLVYQYSLDVADYVWNVVENITKHIYCGTLYSR